MREGFAPAITNKEGRPFGKANFRLPALGRSAVFMKSTGTETVAAAKPLSLFLAKRQLGTLLANRSDL